MVILLTCSVIVYLAVCLLFLCVFAAVAREGRGSNQITSVSNKSRKMLKKCRYLVNWYTFYESTTKQTHTGAHEPTDDMNLNTRPR